MIKNLNKACSAIHEPCFLAKKVLFPHVMELEKFKASRLVAKTPNRVIARLTTNFKLKASINTSNNFIANNKRYYSMLSLTRFAVL